MRTVKINVEVTCDQVSDDVSNEDLAHQIKLGMGRSIGVGAVESVIATTSLVWEEWPEGEGASS